MLEPAKDPISIFHVLKAYQTQAKPAIWGASGVALFWGLYSEWNDRGKPSSFLLHAHDIMARSGIRNRSDAQRAREALVADGVITATEFSQKQGLWRFELHLESLTSERVTHPYQTVSEPSGDGKEIVAKPPGSCDTPVTEYLPPLGTEKEKKEGEEDKPPSAAMGALTPSPTEAERQARDEVRTYAQDNYPPVCSEPDKWREVETWATKLGAAVCILAIDKAKAKGARARFVLTILEDWWRKGITSVEAARAEFDPPQPRAGPGSSRRVSTGGRGANLPRDAPRALNQVEGEPIVTKWMPRKKGAGPPGTSPAEH